MSYEIKVICNCFVVVGILVQLIHASIENKKKNTMGAIYELLWALIWILLIK